MAQNFDNYVIVVESCICKNDQYYFIKYGKEFPIQQASLSNLNSNEIIRYLDLGYQLIHDKGMMILTNNYKNIDLL